MKNYKPTVPKTELLSVVQSMLDEEGLRVSKKDLEFILHVFTEVFAFYLTENGRQILLDIGTFVVKERKIKSKMTNNTEKTIKVIRYRPSKKLRELLKA